MRSRLTSAGSVEPCDCIDVDAGPRANFDHFIGIDCSGAETPEAGLRNLQIYAIETGQDEAYPWLALDWPFGYKCACWSRKMIAQCLLQLVRENKRFIAGIDPCSPLLDERAPFDGALDVIGQERVLVQRAGFSREDLARWLADMTSRGALEQYFSPPLTLPERTVAAREGWILGVR